MKKEDLSSERKARILVAIILFVIIISAAVYFLISSQRESKILVIYHWWTSSSEKAALNALVDVFSKQYPDTTVISTPVTGGAGYSMIDIIKPLVIAGEAPDVFQMHAGYEAEPYYNAGLLDSIDELWESEELEKVVPRSVQTMCQFEGHYYSVPVDIHRANLIWYNKKLLDENNISIDSITDWDSFFKACDKLKSAGIKYPIQMGADWTAAHVFESIIAGEGIDFYEDWINGKITSEDNPKLLNAFETFKKYLSYVNPDNAKLEWDDITARIISGEGAFNIMGDWANGDFKIAGMKYGIDYGTITVPNTENMYGLVIDTFQHPKGIVHTKSSYNWLKVVSSSEGQDAFNPIKGSISARIDTNVSKYDLYSQKAIWDFINIRYMFPSVVHGSGAPEEFKIKLKEVISNFVLDLDSKKAAKELTDYTKEISDKYNIVWSLLD
jgi:glucose/mannose transport system substrate-binding protein